jgi:deoxyribodipyrimidine photo-lyase
MTRIVWFRNDLRIHDHAGITAAEQSGDDWIGVYIFNTNQHNTWLGQQRSSPRRRAWRYDAVNHLKQAIETRGGTFTAHHGNPQTILPKLINKHDITTVHVGIEPGTEEHEDRRAIEPHCNINTHYTTWLWHPDDHDKTWDDTPHVYGDYRRYVENNSHVREPRPAPDTLNGASVETTMPDRNDVVDGNVTTPDQTSIPFQPTETAALERLTSYINQGLPKKYKYTRNQLSGKDFSTKFSIWLAHGAISPRRIYHAIENYEATHGSTKSTYWIKFELTWRDFFRYQAMKHRHNLYTPGGIQALDIPWDDDETKLKRWHDGTTGYPLVDAGMRELTTTGYMSNRARQNVASFLTKNLHIDWRLGAVTFERYLLDYDPASNYGNWQYTASIGNDTYDCRYFNVTKQAKKYDAHNYIKQWVPELQNADNPIEPWDEDTDYPDRIVDFRTTINKAKQWF